MPNAAGLHQIGPTLLTASLATVGNINKGIWVEAMTFANTDATDRTVQVKAGDGSVFIQQATIPGTGSTGGGEPRDYPIPEGGLFFPGGLQASASLTSVVYMWARIRNA